MLKYEDLNNIYSLGAFCALCPCKINNVNLDYNDFGEKYDIEPENAEEFGCGNMQFMPFVEIKQDILIKYNLTEDEYRKIQDKLDCLSFGCCGWCV